MPYGFTNAAEQLNGRAAMMGFTVAYFQEAIVGKGVLEQYGLPYDEGAILMQGGFNGPIFAILGFFFAVALTAGLTFGGETLYNKVFNPNYKGTKLPFNPFGN